MDEKLNIPEQDASPEPLFKCRACGCKELQVTRRFTRSTHVEATLSCDCGAEEVATIHRYRIDALFEQTGTLDDCYQYELDAPDEIEALGTEEEEYEVRCPACAEGADETCWEIDPLQIEVEDYDDEFYVHCQGCGREVESDLLAALGLVEVLYGDRNVESGEEQPTPTQEACGRY